MYIYIYVYIYIYIHVYVCMYKYIIHRLFIVHRQVFQDPLFVHFKPSLDALSLQSDVISSIKILPFRVCGLAPSMPETPSSGTPSQVLCAQAFAWFSLVCVCV